ncbi:hypothetical protein VKT23_001183 [Stygiomarasmius scandens]|uniref:Brain protein I3 n=1 Tax=Marasmiellus scandens TaxID=2682957 RepID=A0ABR1K6D0_9AGAR
MAAESYDNPPSYDAATEGALNVPAKDVKQSEPQSQQQQSSPPVMHAGPSYVPAGYPSPTVYHYVNPVTQEHVASLLPPDHPEMICLQSGQHLTETNFGILGILAAVIWFPLGIGLCLLDRRVKCKRCGHVIDGGVCS